MKPKRKNDYYRIITDHQVNNIISDLKLTFAHVEAYCITHNIIALAAIETKLMCMENVFATLELWDIQKYVNCYRIKLRQMKHHYNMED